MATITTWTLFPWFTLMVFFLLVYTFWPRRLFGGVPPYSLSEGSSVGGGIVSLLMISLIVGAALCILLDYAMN
jgi:hypothetical protein